jgi:hypothetical protein
VYLPSEVRLSWLASVMTAPRSFEVMDGRCEITACRPCICCRPRASSGSCSALPDRSCICFHVDTRKITYDLLQNLRFALLSKDGSLIAPTRSLFCCSKFPVRAKTIPCSVAQGILR